MKRKLLYVVLILVLSLSMTISAFGQAPASQATKSKVKSYIVIMANDPVIA
jgi:hypothetical protein